MNYYNLFKKRCTIFPFLSHIHFFLTSWEGTMYIILKKRKSIYHIHIKLQQHSSLCISQLLVNWGQSTVALKKRWLRALLEGFIVFGLEPLTFWTATQCLNYFDTAAPKIYPWGLCGKFANHCTTETMSCDAMIHLKHLTQVKL